MNRYDESYSAYFAAPDADYPVGSAIDSTSEDNLDGTPYLAAFFNDVIGFMQATFFGVFGTDAQVSNTPETARKSDVWNAIQKFVGDSDIVVKDALDADIADINAKIPAQASAQNQLADKDFVDSSIATNTAYFIGTFNSVAELNAYTGTKTNNDYAFVQSMDAAGNTIFKRYKWNGTAWLYEYELNNSSFTANQWAAINSGATASQIARIRVMTGANSVAPGQEGLVPTPPSGAQNKVLKGNGQWEDISSFITIQAAFNAAHPVGSTYVQYPQQDAPATLYNKDGIQSTWQVVSYSGAFFRAEGGNAAAFIEKTGNLIKQFESVPNVKGYIGDLDRWRNKLQDAEAMEAIGASGKTNPFFHDDFVLYKDAKDGNTGNIQTVALDLSRYNRAYGRREEVAPANYTIRVWKRIS